MKKSRIKTDDLTRKMKSREMSVIYFIMTRPTGNIPAVGVATWAVGDIGLNIGLLSIRFRV